MQHISKNQVKYIRSLQQKKVRDAEGVFVAEGHKCIEELIEHFPLKMLVFSNVDDTWTHSRPIVDSIAAVARDLSETSARPQRDLIFEATETEIEQMSSMRTPQGMIAVFQRHKSDSTATLPDPQNELVLVLDGVQDPGNLGTIIRTADWFGIRHIVCSHDTADCWNPKVVQATMGALARVRLHYVNLVEWIGEQRGCAASRAASPTFCKSTLPQGELERHPLPIYGTLLDGVNMYTPGAIPQKQNGIIIMGNEGNGISPEVRTLITHPLFIPSFQSPETLKPTETLKPATPAADACPEHVEGKPAEPLNSSKIRVESLNVAIATAVILAEFRRK